MEDARFEILERSYGKESVKLLHVTRNGLQHSITEYEVSTRLQLASDKDYIKADNSDIIATDSQKNTIYLLAKQHGVGNPEEFGLLVARHFLTKYPGNVVKAVVEVVEVHPWKRINGCHNHAFVSGGDNKRSTKVVLEAGKEPEVTGKLQDLLVLKTTQSAFADFIDDEYRILPNATDRIMSTSLELEWNYRCVKNIDFDSSYEKIMNIIFEEFAGDNVNGLMSESVQQTAYFTLCKVLESIPSIEKIYMKMPNKHYYSIDLSKFPASVGGCKDNNEVFLPVDAPSGVIELTLKRKE